MEYICETCGAINPCHKDEHETWCEVIRDLQQEVKDLTTKLNRLEKRAMHQR